MLATEIKVEAESAMTRFRRYLLRYFHSEEALSQGEIAEKAGISRVHLNRIVQGHAEPTLTIAEQIAVATGSTLSKILEKKMKNRQLTA